MHRPPAPERRGNQRTPKIHPWPPRPGWLRPLPCRTRRTARARDGKLPVPAPRRSPARAHRRPRRTLRTVPERGHESSSQGRNSQPLANEGAGARLRGVTSQDRSAGRPATDLPSCRSRPIRIARPMKCRRFGQLVGVALVRALQRHTAFRTMPLPRPMNAVSELRFVSVRACTHVLQAITLP